MKRKIRRRNERRRRRRRIKRKRYFITFHFTILKVPSPRALC